MTLETRISDLALAIAGQVNSLRSGKVDKITGKGLSTNDYTDNDKASVTIGHDIVNYTAMAGAATGGDISLTGGIGFSVSAGNGFIRNSTNDIIPITWGSLTGSVPVAGDNFIYLDMDGAIIYRTLKDDHDNIFLGYITTNDDNTAVLGFNNNKFLYDQYFSRLNQFIENSIGTMVEYGFELTPQSAPNTLKVISEAGSLWQDFNQFVIPQLNTFRKFFRDSAGTYFEDISTPNYINNTQYNDISLSGSSALVNMTAGYYKKDLFFISTKGNLFYQHGTSEYSEAEHAFGAAAPEVNPASTNVTVIAHVIIQEGNPVPVAIIDMRSSFHRLWNGHYFRDLIPTISHHEIQGMLEDDHLQYHTDARGDTRYYTKTQLDAGQLNTLYYTELEVDTLLSGKSNVIHPHNNANSTTAGYLTASDFNKLAGIEAGATANQTDSYLLSRTNHTGTQDVSTITGLVKSSVGLGNVDNTSDANKPISTATQTALNDKVDKITGKSLSENDFTDFYKGEVDLSTYMATELGSSVNVSGGVVSLTGGVNFSISPGVGYTRDNTGKMVRVAWSTLTGTCAYDSDNFINIDYQGNIVISTGAAQGDLIALGYIRTAFANTTVVGFSNTRLRGNDFMTHLGELFRTTIGSLVQSGCNTAMQATPNDLKITVGSGYIWSLFNRFTFTDTSAFTKLFNTTDYGFIPDTATTANTVNTAYWNDTSQPAVSALVPLTTNYYKKDLIALTPEGTVLYVYANDEWATLDEARVAPTPAVPESIKLSIIRSAAIISKQGDTAITELIDIRPMMSRLFDTGQAATNSTVISHSNLTDLGNDDHLQYLNTTRGDSRYYRKTELDSGSLDTRYYTESEVNALLSAKANTAHTHVTADITDLSKTSVGLGNVQNVDQTDASNITSGTLDNARLTANLNSIGNIVKSNGDIIAVVGGVYSARTIAQYKADLSLNNVQNVNQTDAANITSGTLDDARLSANLTDIGGLSFNTNDMIQFNGTNLVNISMSSVKTSLSLTKGDVGLGSVQNVDQTNASNITSGTLANARLTANLSQIGGLTLSTGDFFQFNGATVTNVTPLAVKSSLSLTKGDVGLGSVQNVDQTNASNITSGTLANTRLTAHLGQIGGLTFTINDIIYYNGTALSNITPASYKSLLSLTKTDVGLSNVANVDTSNASNISSGTLSDSRLSTNLTQLGGITFATNDFMQYNGTTLVKVTPTQVKTALSLTKSDVGLSNVPNVDTSNASNITTGTLPLSVIPAGALDRLVIVADQAARYALTTATAQTGDTIKQLDTDTMYYIKDDTNLGNSAGYEVYTAGSATSVPYSGITSLPANISQLGGITFSTNDIAYYNGTVVTNISPTSYKALLSLTKSDVGLSNVANSLQVINAGNGVSFASGNTASRPTAGTNGRLYASTDNGIFLDNGASWVVQQAAISGDISISANSTTATLATVNSNVGTFNNVTVNAKGLVTSASNVSYLTTNQTITLSGDVSGSGTTAITVTLPTINTNVGTFNNVTVNGKGQVTAASNVSYLTGNQTITASGDVSGSGTTSLALTLATVNSNVGTFNNVTVNGKGLVTAASNVSYLTGNQTITASGDVTGSGTTGIALTLATVNSNVGSFGSTSAVPVITVNGKGLITAVSTAALTSSSVGLGNVTNSLQVINAGGAVSHASGANSSRPTVGTTGRFYSSTDQGITYFDNGTTWSAQLPAYTGDVTSALGGTALTLATVNSNVGTFNNVTVNAKGLVTAASNVSYLTGNQTITVSGDATGSGTTGIALTLATVNSNVGTFNNVTVNAKGLVTAASNVSYLTGNQTITLSGDITGSGTTTITGTLATVNSNVGTFNNVTVNAKGLVTAASNANYLVDSTANGVLVRTSLNTTAARTITGTTDQITVTNGDGVAGNPTLSIADNPVIPGTGSMTLPIGTIAQLPAQGNGKVRFNSERLYEEISESGVWRPMGRLMQFQTGDIAQTTGTTILPYDATLPTSAEGFQIWTATITPFYANSTIVVMFSVMGECSVAAPMVSMVLYNGTTAIAASSSYAGAANVPRNLTITKRFLSGVTTPITLSGRIGPSAAGTVYVNRGNTETFGGTLTTSYIIMEIY